MVGATHYMLFLKVLWLSALITLWGRNKRPLVWNTAIMELGEHLDTNYWK
jgi:hypothetical protein